MQLSTEKRTFNNLKESLNKVLIERFGFTEHSNWNNLYKATMTKENNVLQFRFEMLTDKLASKYHSGILIQLDICPSAWSDSITLFLDRGHTLMSETEVKYFSTTNLDERTTTVIDRLLSLLDEQII